MSRQQVKSELLFKVKWLKRKLQLLHDTRKERDIEMMLFEEIDRLVYSTKCEVIVERFNHQLTRGDLITLDWNASGESAWLNDNIINSFMAMINQRSKENSHLPQVYAFNSHLMEKFKHGYSYETVRRWTTRAKINLFAMKKKYLSR